MSNSEDVADELLPNAAGSAEMSSSHREALGRFIVFWGEMASNWGINRTMAQIHALLYCSEEPLDTDEIMQRLDISRGNANMNLRSLVSWRLISKVQQSGSRKDYYEAEKDVWTITAQIIKEREQREIRPVTEQLQDCKDVLAGGADSREELAERERLFLERIENLMQLMEFFNSFSKVLLPFVQRRDKRIMRKIVEFAELLRSEKRE